MAILYGHDKTIKVGDLIRAYHKGIHRVIAIDKMSGDNGYAYTYEQLLTANWKPSKKKTVNNCNSAWCQKVTPKSMRLELADLVDNYIDAAILLFGSGVVAQWESNTLAE